MGNETDDGECDFCDLKPGEEPPEDATACPECKRAAEQVIDE